MKKLALPKECIGCGDSFEKRVFNSWKVWGLRKFCSKKCSNVFNKNRYWLGKKRSDEDKKKFKDSHIGQIAWNKGKKNPKMSNENHPNWKGGVSKRSDYNAFQLKRRKARKRNNGGTHTIFQWEALKEKFSYMCLCCKRFEPEIKLTQDHIMPLKLGGSDNIENIQPLCNSCNSRKQARYIDYISPYFATADYQY